MPKENTSGFLLSSQLARDTTSLGRFPLCQVLLMDDSQFPWCILVPRRAGISEIYELSQEDQQQLSNESVCLGKLLMEIFAGDKLNVAALGNVVPQLHIHHLVRYRHDSAWPRPVWGVFPPVRYSASELATLKKNIINKLSSSGIIFQPEAG